MITGDQIIAHAVGDYLLQSDWMANNKTKNSIAALAHALVYSLCFLVFSPHPVAFLVICGTHFLIDRFRLARYVVWAKNWIAPPPKISYEPNGTVRFTAHNLPWVACDVTGYPKDRPVWLATWLLIFADNTLHILINGLALRYL